MVVDLENWIILFVEVDIYYFMRGFEDERLEDENLLRSIKEQKEHAERGVDQLLDHFSEKGQYFDELKQLGSKYEHRIREFEQIRMENTDLKNETRKLQDQLSLFRNSLQDSGWKEEDFMNRLSMERAKPESTLNQLSSEPSARDVMKSKLDDIEKMKEQARVEYSDQYKDYDDLLKSVFRFLEMTYATKNMLTEMKAVSDCQINDD